MAAIRGTNTSIEITLRRELWAAGVRYRIHDRRLPGIPDMVVARAKLAVFVHGCFWHGCPKHYRAPLTNKEYWKAKLQHNRRRDRSVRAQLRKMTWKVVVVWECRIRDDPRAAASPILKVLESSGRR